MLREVSRRGYAPAHRLFREVSGASISAGGESACRNVQPISAGHVRMPASEDPCMNLMRSFASAGVAANPVNLMTAVNMALDRAMSEDAR